MEKILVVEANALLNPITGLLTFDTATKNCTEIQQAVIQSNYETIPVFIAHLFIDIEGYRDIEIMTAQTIISVPTESTNLLGQTLPLMIDFGMGQQPFAPLYSIDDSGNMFIPSYVPMAGTVNTDDPQNCSISSNIKSSVFNTAMWDEWSCWINPMPVIPLFTISGNGDVAYTQQVDVVLDPYGWNGEYPAIAFFGGYLNLYGKSTGDVMEIALF